MSKSMSQYLNEQRLPSPPTTTFDADLWEDVDSVEVKDDFWLAEGKQSFAARKELPKSSRALGGTRYQVKVFKDGNALGTFLGKQSNEWESIDQKNTLTIPSKSGTYKQKMARNSQGKGVFEYIKEDVESDTDEVLVEAIKKNDVTKVIDIANKFDAALRKVHVSRTQSQAAYKVWDKLRSLSGQLDKILSQEYQKAYLPLLESKNQKDD